MGDGRVERLARALKADGRAAPPLERLRERLGVAESQQALEREIAQEIAAALGRSGAKVELALARLAEAGSALDAAPDELERRRCLERFETYRRAALAARHELLIHREAVGIRRHGELERQFAIPRRRT
jgi:hypothetical protein